MLLCIMFPATGTSHPPVLLDKAPYSLFQFRSEMSDQTLQRPRECFAKCYGGMHQYECESVRLWTSLPQMVCPSTCLVNS